MTARAPNCDVEPRDAHLGVRLRARVARVTLAFLGLTIGAFLLLVEDAHHLLVLVLEPLAELVDLAGLLGHGMQALRGIGRRLVAGMGARIVMLLVQGDGITAATCLPSFQLGGIVRNTGQHHAFDIGGI